MFDNNTLLTYYCTVKQTEFKSKQIFLMTCTLNEDLRRRTYDAFKRHGGQAEAARQLGTSKQYVWQVLNGARTNDKMLLELSGFILEKIKKADELKEEMKDKVEKLDKALAA